MEDLLSPVPPGMEIISQALQNCLTIQHDTAGPGNFERLIDGLEAYGFQFRNTQGRRYGEIGQTRHGARRDVSHKLFPNFQTDVV